METNGSEASISEVKMNDNAGLAVKVKQTMVKLYKFMDTWTGTIIFVLLFTFFVAQQFAIPSGSMQGTLLIGDRVWVSKFAYGVSDPRIPFLELPLTKSKNGHIIDGEKPKGGDIVVFRYPLNDKIHFVKRCVAVPGDEVMLHNKDLYICPKDKTSMDMQYREYERVMIGGKQWVKNPYTKEHSGIHNSLEPIANFERFGEYAQELVSPDIYYKKHKFDQIVFENGKTLLADEDRQQRKYYFGPFTLGDEQFFMMGDNRDNSADSRYWGPVNYSNVIGRPLFIFWSIDDNFSLRFDRFLKTTSRL